MKISVVIPTYNASATIVDVLNSIMNQSLRPYEVLLVDDCSTDQTVELASQVDGITIYQLKKNYGGPAWPRNYGISQAKGDCIAFCDADDIWHIEKLERQAEIMTQFGVKFVSCGRKIITKYEFFDSKSAILHCRTQYVEKRDFRYQNPIVNSSVLIDRKILERNKFIEDPRLIAVEDYELYERIHRLHTSIKINENLVGYLENGQGISAQKFKMLKKVYKLKRMQASVMGAVFIVLLSVVRRTFGVRAR